MGTCALPMPAPVDGLCSLDPLGGLEPEAGFCRAAIHLSLLALYGLGGLLVSRGLMPIRVLLSAIGFTFSLVFATQGVVQSFSDTRRVSACLRR